jgi:DNA-binding response OmpR family regulator
MSSKTRILVVEDDPNALRILQVALEGEGYQVSTASDGGEALRKAREEKPDLAILDIMLPGIDGYQICRYLRSNPDTATMPVLMLTAKTGGRAQMAGFESGADDYLFKPINLEEVLKRVKALLWAEGWSG